MKTELFKTIAKKVNREEVLDMMAYAEDVYVRRKDNGSTVTAIRAALKNLYDNIAIAVKQDFVPENISAWTEIFSDLEYVITELKVAAGSRVGNGRD